MQSTTEKSNEELAINSKIAFAVILIVVFFGSFIDNSSFSYSFEQVGKACVLLMTVRLFLGKGFTAP